MCIVYTLRLLSIKGTSLYLFRDSVASLSGARNPHVLSCTLRFLCSVRLALEPLMTINRGALKKSQEIKDENEYCY